MTVLSVLKYGTGASAKICADARFGAGSTSMNLVIKDTLNQLLKNTNIRVLSVRQLNTSSALLQNTIKTPPSRVFHVTPSRYAWHQYKDMFHFYFLLGALPLLALVFFVNIYIGPPTLAEIPPGYVPKEWEYQRHPITQAMLKTFFAGYQQQYERNLFYFKEEDEKRRMRLLSWRAEALMRERGDFYNYYNNTTLAGKYMRKNMEENKRIHDNLGSRFNFDSDRDVTGPLEK